MNILIITNKNDITSDFIVQNLTDKNASFYRLNTNQIGDSVQLSFNVVTSQYHIVDLKKNLLIDLLKIKSVYFRRPEIVVHSTGLSLGEANYLKSELAFSLEALYKILSKAFWVNTVESIRKAENKIYQLLIAKEIGFSIPNSILTNNPKDALKFYNLNNEQCIIKPIKSGLIAGEIEEGVIFTSKVDLNETNSKRITGCPIYLQNLIPKKADVRITVVGNEIFGALIDSQQEEESSVDWRKANYALKHSILNIPSEIKEKCFELTKTLNLNFGAIDFILDKKDNFIFLEINPNGQWAWIEKQLNFNISHAITTLLVKQNNL